MPALASDLALVGEVQEWLGTQSDTPMLQVMVSQISRAIMNRLNRPSLLPFRYVEQRDGTGGDRLLLRNWPALQINTLSIDGQAITAALSQGAGYMLEISDIQPPGAMQSLVMRGSSFARGTLNVLVDYTCGYRVSETIVGPAAPFQIAAMAIYGRWASDEGVTLAGASMAKVAASPAAGQYAVTASGVYTFAAADAGKTMILSHGYIPADLTRCCIDWVSAVYRQKDRIGLNSKTLGGQETVSFRTDRVPPFVDEALRGYMAVVPV